MAARAHTLTSEHKTGKAAALLHTLVPKAEVFALYDLARSCIWSTSGLADPEIDSFVAELIDETISNLARSDQALRRSLQSGRTLLALPVFGEDREMLAILVCLFASKSGRTDENTSSGPPTTIQSPAFSASPLVPNTGASRNA